MTETPNLAEMVQKMYDSVFVKQESEVLDEAAPAAVLMSKIVTHFPQEISNLAFGDSMAKLLYSIGPELDFEHPEVKCGKFVSLTDDQANKTLEFLYLCEIVLKSDLTHIQEDIYKCLSRIVPDIRPILLKLKNHQKMVRMFASEEKRRMLRDAKEAKMIELFSSVKRFMGIWDAIDSLEVYARGGSYYQDQINFVKSKIDVYSKMRLTHMVAELETSLAEFNQNVDENYYGFQRVPMVVVSVLLAKMMGGNISGSNITFPYQYRGYSDAIYYRPMACPWNSNLSTPLPNLDKLKAVIQHLDHFPEANYKPIFDHFIVVSPNFPERDGFTYQSIYALLGEKDGKCYFIYYWI